MDTLDIKVNTNLGCRYYIDVIEDMEIVVNLVSWLRLRLLLAWDPELRPAPVNHIRSTLPQFSPLYMSLKSIWILEGDNGLIRSRSISPCSRFHRA